MRMAKGTFLLRSNVVKFQPGRMIVFGDFL